MKILQMTPSGNTKSITAPTTMLYISDSITAKKKCRRLDRKQTIPQVFDAEHSKQLIYRHSYRTQYRKFTLTHIEARSYDIENICTGYYGQEN